VDKHRFPQKAASTMIKIKEGLYVSRHDPNYYKKLLRFRSSDPEILYGYAGQLSKEGNPEALSFYKKAAAYGHAASIGKLAELKRDTNRPMPPVLPPGAKDKPKPGDNRVLWPFIVSLLLILLALLFLLFAFIYQTFIFEKTEYHYHYGTSSSTILTQEQGRAGMGSIGSSVPVPAGEPGQLYGSVLFNAILNYHSSEGQYPESLDKLEGATPDNWVSYIPKGMKVEKKGTGFMISEAGLPVQLQPSRLELQFYPEENLLGLAQDKRLLVLYPVASGLDGKEFPYKESKVNLRVVEPNGGQGALGTRGMELSEGFAIHGTNNEASIGNRVTNGCLRMNNRDIEALYPYVPLGTAFKVMEGKPEQAPVYQAGLPPVPSWNMEKEKTPEVVYHWRG
jgi:hypothetical protein